MFIVDFFKTNPMALAILGGGTSTAILTYLLNTVKWIPNTIVSSFMAHVTTVIQLTERSHHLSDDDVDKIRELESYIRSFNHRVIDNSLNMDAGDNYTRLPEGVYYIFKTIFKHGVILTIKVYTIENKADGFKPIIYRYKINVIGSSGRRNKFVTSLLERLSHKKEDENESLLDNKIITLNTHTNNRAFLSVLNKRDLDSIYMDESIKKEIMDHIVNFIGNRHIYDKYKIIYKTGLILYGEPGTGKTSLIRAIASSVDAMLLTVDHKTSIETVQEMIRAIRADEFSNRTGFSWKNICKRINVKSTPVIIVFEEMDKFFISASTKNDKKKSKTEDGVINNSGDVMVTKESPSAESEKIDEVINGLDNNILDKMLQFFDGINSPENVIFLATTNYIERLDPALIRPGRFDLCVEMKRLTSENAEKMVSDMIPTKSMKDYNEYIKPDGTINSSELFTKLISDKIKEEVFNKKKI